jgi:glutathione S-transferase
MTHLIAMLYPRWHLPKMPHSPDTLLDDLVQRLTPNVHNDLDAVERALERSDYLVGSRLTAADIMVSLSLHLVRC